ncbi:MAG: hypothetical protein ACK5HY_02485 [Parahaliea sp.]
MLVLLLAFTGGSALAGDQELKACQRLKDSIESYDNKRRAGGSAARMERWKRARQAKKDQWDQLGCRHLRHRLR